MDRLGGRAGKSTNHFLKNMVGFGKTMVNGLLLPKYTRG